MFQAVIAFGSNLENPAEQVIHAMQTVQKLPEISHFIPSSLYRSTPVGYADQPDFINAVALVQTTFTPEQLLATLHRIEEDAGRIRSFRNAPRTLDLDLIDYQNEVHTHPNLTLPHPRAHERSFVLLPLAEIAPHYQIGTHGQAGELAKHIDKSGIQLFKTL